jgi:undecaprenyl diphosphate synthase
LREAAVAGKALAEAVTDVNWPAFRKIDFLRAVRAFQQRNRRFAG